MGNVRYDNVGFFSFAIVLLGMVIVPLTLYKAASCKKKKKKRRRGVALLQTVGSLLGWTFVVVGWALLLQMTMQVMSMDTDVFDPYEILGLDTSASKRAVLKAYRQLSLTNHPDKGGDAARFALIVKAKEVPSFRSLSPCPPARATHRAARARDGE